MFGFGSLIGKLSNLDKRNQAEETKNPLDFGSGWGDDDIDLIEDESPEQNHSPEKKGKLSDKPLQNKMEEKVNNSEKTNALGMVSKIFSRAGNFVA